MSTCDFYCGIESVRNDRYEVVGYTHHHMTVSRPRYVEYIARARLPYERRYTILCRTDSRPHAYRVLAEAMHDGKWKRGDVLGSEGPESYYEPRVLVEMTQ